MMQEEGAVGQGIFRINPCPMMWALLPDPLLEMTKQLAVVFCIDSITHRSELSQDDTRLVEKTSEHRLLL